MFCIFSCFQRSFITLRYEISNIETTTAPIQPATRSGTVYKVNLSTAGANTTSSTGLKSALADMQAVTFRNSRAFKFENINKKLDLYSN